MESLIGRKYIPNDNSYQVNITTAGKSTGINICRHLAGVYRKSPKTCIIVSEPFECKVLQSDELLKSITMICIDYNNETHCTVFDPRRIE
jgi:hypothetical protein